MVKKSDSKDFFEEYAVKEEDEQEEQISFFKRMKTDKKYSAKVQLIGYAVFLVLLVVGINVSDISITAKDTASQILTILNS